MFNIPVSKISTEVRLMLNGILVRLNPLSRRIVPNKIVFICNHGRGYGCNPKYIAEELRSHDDESLEMVWLCRKHDNDMPKEIRQVRYGSYKALMELATARVWIDNSRTRRYVSKKPQQFLIQTWHAGTSLKKIEKDAESSLSPLYIHGAKQDGRETNLMFANSDFMVNLMQTKFWYDGPVIKCGLPRNVPLVHQKPETRDRVRKALGVVGDEKICLYAPTFRSNSDLTPYIFDYERCCKALEERFGGKFVFAIRLHPNIAHLHSNLQNNNVINASYYNDAQELVSAADVLITDYSTISEDFALTKKPGYLYAPDIESYNMDRGLYFSLEDLAFPIAYSESQLIDTIKQTEDATFEEKRRSYFDKIGLSDDGTGASTIASIIRNTIASSFLEQKIS